MSENVDKFLLCRTYVRIRVFVVDRIELDSKKEMARKNVQKLCVITVEFI